jgi:putative heme degradation protein
VTTVPQTPFSLLIEAPGDVIYRLSRLGRVMIINSHRGVTHERIGMIESVTTEGEWLICNGSAHDCRIHLPSIARMVIDTSSIMAEKTYPRIDFYDAQSQAMFSIVSFEGLIPFMATISELNTQPYPGAKSPFETMERKEVSPDDPCLVPLNAALASGAKVTIAIERPGFIQRWQGFIDKLVPSMGFINVMVADFHFHLRAGAVGRWHEATGPDGVTLAAIGHDSAPLGLTLSSSSATAFDTAETRV